MTLEKQYNHTYQKSCPQHVLTKKLNPHQMGLHQDNMDVASVAVAVRSHQGLTINSLPNQNNSNITTRPNYAPYIKKYLFIYL